MAEVAEVPAPAATEETAPAAIEQTPEEKAMVQLKLIFDSIDANSSGTVDKAEFQNALEKNTDLGSLIKDAGLNPGFKALEKIDSNKDGHLTWTEFSEYLKKAAEEEVQATGNVAGVEMAADEKALQQLRIVFDSADLDKDNTVSSEELSVALKKDTSLADLVSKAGFNENFANPSKEGRISWEEFQDHLRGVAKEEVKETGEVAAACPVEIEGEEKSKGSCWSC